MSEEGERSLESGRHVFLYKRGVCVLFSVGIYNSRIKVLCGFCRLLSAKDKVPPLSLLSTFLTSFDLDYPSKNLLSGKFHLAAFSWTVMNLCMVKFFDSMVNCRNGKQHRLLVSCYCVLFGC